MQLRLLRWWLPAPALLTVVACAQLAASELGTLHRWKGGGFAMFASNEKRALQVHVARGARCLSHSARWPEGMLLEMERLATVPTERGLRRLGETLASGEWLFYFESRDDDQLRMTRASTAARLGTRMGQPATFDSVQIDAWRLRFHPEGEDRDLDGALGLGEDVDGDGALDAPIVVPERILRWSSVPDREGA